MQYTPNYNLIIAEGTDAVNPLTQIFPNFTSIDTAMEANKEHGVTTASEVTTGGVHALVRVDSSVPVFRYTATSAWTTGDTMTLDGSAVTVHLADGTAPKSGAYVIGAEVLAIVNGSLVTLMTGASFEGVTSFNGRQNAVTPQSGDYSANQIGYNNTGSGLTATDAQAAIDELAGMSPDLSWKLAGREQGVTPVALPNTYNEIVVMFNYAATSTRSTVVIPKAAIDAGYITDIYQTTVGGSNIVGAIYATVSASAVALGSFMVGGGDVTANAITTVYYR